MFRSIILISFLSSFTVSAAVPLFQDITEEQFKGITREFSANFVHTAVTPPASLGDVFGIEIGVVGGITASDETNKVVNSIDSDTTVENIPHAAIMAQVSIPFGISLEATMFPETEQSDLSISTFSFAGKWTLTDSLIKIPFIDIAARFHMSSSEASFKTTDKVSDVPVDSEVVFDSSSWGANITIGANLFLIKPYAGLGYVSTDTDLSVAATSGTIFDTSFTSAQSASETHSGLQTILGAELDLFILHIGAEYSNLLDTSKYSMKVSIAI
ncbi:MAG: hypothetical protein BM556_13775 [Bacteriovorax sp. MedPE-SWde]|nr:MAG: hypothetical protein BM556_13775 [Bacteriovorax sp. MedPE-SWde]